MTNQQIKDLLIEASNPNCTTRRRNEIQCIFGSSSVAHAEGYKPYDIDTPAAGMLLVLESLYVKTLEEKPEKLVSLFPVFALICGDREEDSLTGQIDWSLL